MLARMIAGQIVGCAIDSVHIARFGVAALLQSRQSLAQFYFAPLLEEARLLADARVDAIAWNGTSGGWLGLEIDRELCRRIAAETGIRATTSSLALLEGVRLIGATRIGWATPYLDEIQSRIIDTFAAEGIACAAERHLGDRGNFSFSEIAPERIAAMAREVAASRPD